MKPIELAIAIFLTAVGGLLSMLLALQSAFATKLSIFLNGLLFAGAVYLFLDYFRITSNWKWIAPILVILIFSFLAFRVDLQSALQPDPDKVNVFLKNGESFHYRGATPSDPAKIIDLTPIQISSERADKKVGFVFGIANDTGTRLNLIRLYINFDPADRLEVSVPESKDSPEWNKWHCDKPGERCWFEWNRIDSTWRNTHPELFVKFPLSKEYIFKFDIDGDGIKKSIEAKVKVHGTAVIMKGKA